jgi:hypothetical protein
MRASGKPMYNGSIVQRSEEHGSNQGKATTFEGGSEKMPIEPEYDWSVRPIWEVAVELGNQIPDDELAKLPRDLSINIEHYLYGTPRVGP